MIDEKLKKFFNKFPHIKENKPLQTTLSKKINNLIKKELQHGASQIEAEQKALLNLTDLDTLLSQLKSLEATDYSKYNDFFAKIFDSKLVNELKLKLNQIDEIHLNYRLGDILVLPTNSPNLIVHDFMSRDIENLHSTVEKIGNVLKITQGPRKLVGIFKNKTLLFLPKEFTGFLTIRSQSGDVYINKIPSYCMIDITAVSGDLLLAHSTLKRVQADLKSGDIAVSATSANVFHINAHSGMLTADNINAKEEISYHTTSGNMDLENISSKNFFIDTKTGKITVNQLKSQNIEILTDSGNITLNNSEGKGNVKANTGKINLSLDKSNQFNLSIQSKIGNIHIHIPDTISFTFNVDTKKIGLTDLPLNSIIYSSDDYDKVKGYVGAEDSNNSLNIESDMGKVSIKNPN
ncbi:hypothetical protein CBF60_07375 [Lactobacillus taiwanensis]|uniref:DUF4097 family beta strand repeat-containing protein n=1 Tax=Lactobacillus taiwanensis TaxID=508451 RepID=UPI000B995DEE|nr:DUF4097 family beta strand repeat-containing protein [Lactobacillus taiwanensis]OYS19273.1 hypothetical protein CBF76_06795 [Lactobacillus taiwanensis]OYS22404.1 hypothetical protein CBF55_07755 [Lactobacillus taiwanensis]OYS22805.1 hypothetical protein CBF66_08005 [Lactobacillus taiwanensis]OYS23832.1 hypothetical protein CBF73_07770 [Lactobacillus taiwanensis]OYS27446.1 hypothetical protein CBF60_07375 [Lactobacillus taiwanensis]